MDKEIKKMPEVAIIDKGQVPANAFETYDGIIYDMRQQAYTLEEIGRKIGRTRERVRQILVQYYGSTDINKNFLTTRQLTNEATCSPHLIEKLQQAGLITPIRRGFWDLESTLPIVIKSRPRCKICGKLVPKYRRCYCSDECYKEGMKWINRSEASNRTWLTAMKRWRERNPERLAEIQRRSSYKSYRKLRQKLATELTKKFTKIIPVKLN